METVTAEVRTSEHGIPKLAAFRLVVGLLVCLVSAGNVAQPGATSQSVAAYALLAWVGALVGTWRSSRGVGGAVSIYVIVFGLFHFGLVLSLVVIGPTVLIGQGDNSWIYSSTVPSAVAVVALALAALVAGAGLSEFLPRRSTFVSTSPEHFPNIGLSGTVAMLVGAGIFTYVFASNGGIALVGSGYGKVLESVGDNGLFGYGVFLLGLGASFMVCAGGRYRGAGWIVMVAFALVALPIGMRGAVLFPLLAIVVCEARRKRIRLIGFLVATMLGLTAISVLRQTRLSGVAGLLAGNWTRASPIDGMAEMGYTLYPVVVVENWISSGISYMHGQTLVAPELRLIESLFLGGAIPATSDSRLFNVEVLQTVGPIGGSPVAEGLRNGGTLFVFLLMLSIGLVIARLDGLDVSPLNGALVMVVFLPLLIQVRNSFGPVFVQIAIGLMFVGLSVLFKKSESNRGVRRGG